MNTPSIVTPQTYFTRGNAYLGKSMHNLLLLYAKRRTHILRFSYLVVIYLIFNNGSKSKSKRKSSAPNETPIIQEKNVFKRLLSQFRNSPLIRLFSQFNIKDRNTLKIYKYLLTQIILLLFKAYLSLKLAMLDGNLVSCLISRKFSKFFKFLSIWLVIGVPISLTDSVLEKSKRLLSQSIRSNVTLRLLDDYLPENGNSTIYQLLNIKHDNANIEKITDPNHRITSTVEQFSNSFSILPSQLLSPVLDILIAANHMSKSSKNSSEGALMLGLVANVSTLILKFFTPNFSTLSSMKNTLENKFHEYHSNVILNNEEIALAKGHSREIDLLDTSYFEFEKFERMTLRRMAVYNFAVTFIFKYTLGAFGLLLCAVPTFIAVYDQHDLTKLNDELVSNLSSDFVANRSLLLKASDSLGKLIQSKKNIQNLMGYAKELWNFQKSLIAINESSQLEITINESKDGIEPLLVGPNVSYGNEITFQNVPLITPTNNMLVENLTFSIKPGDNLLIIGPNGCGKSSLFRILGGLWEIKDQGKLIVPYDKRDLFYLPQKSYFTYGSLREQIIYPDSFDDYRNNIIKMKRKKEHDINTDSDSDVIIKDDEYLIELLHKVNLEYLLDYQYDSDNEIDYENQVGDNDSNILTESCLNKVEKWPDLLSVGEQQRLAMIRLYYHQPKFAVLDECTSNISSDLEKECYRIATKDLNITVLSVCHRTSLWSFHSKILKFKRNPGDEFAVTKFSSFDPELRLKRHEELISIDGSLKKSDELTKRLKALKNMKNSRSARRTALLYIDDDN